MKKKTTELNDELRPEYDLKSMLKGGVRGKYAKKYRGDKSYFARAGCCQSLPE